MGSGKWGVGSKLELGIGNRELEIGNWVVCSGSITDTGFWGKVYFGDGQGPLLCRFQ